MLTKTVLKASFLLPINKCTCRGYSHVPVMASEVVKLLDLDDNKTYIDMTFGFGGHSKKLLASNKSITIVAVDRDPFAIEQAKLLAKQVSIKSEKLNIKQKVIPVHGKFSSVIDTIHLQGIQFGSVDGIIFDLGASSIQYDDPSRGFSISNDSPLDMRMDPTDGSTLTAEDVVNNLDMLSLRDIFKVYGQERKSIKIANAILDARALVGRIKTTSELAKIVHICRGSNLDSLGRIAHPATKVFQALRIFVNNELNELNYILGKIGKFLKSSEILENRGKAVVISFHSLEDRIVKKHFNNSDINEPDFKAVSHHDKIATTYETEREKIELINKPLKWIPINKNVLKPRESEILVNPRSRSARLRAAYKIDS